uniref:Transposase n=1 Tax=Ascaris lumbricoides TaxID=6252 RepID=A0A0M3IC91_ASCLU
MKLKSNTGYIKAEHGITVKIQGRLRDVNDVNYGRYKADLREWKQRQLRQVGFLLTKFNTSTFTKKMVSDDYACADH